MAVGTYGMFVPCQVSFSTSKSYYFHTCSQTSSFIIAFIVMYLFYTCLLRLFCSHCPLTYYFALILLLRVYFAPILLLCVYFHLILLRIYFPLTVFLRIIFLSSSTFIFLYAKSIIHFHT